MDLLLQARQLEREFEQKKSALHAQEVKQEMTKQQFVQAKQQLEAIGITFSTGAELQAIFVEKGQRLQELITQYEARKQQAAAATATIPVEIPQATANIPLVEQPQTVAPQQPAPPSMQQHGLPDLGAINIDDLL